MHYNINNQHLILHTAGQFGKVYIGRYDDPSKGPILVAAKTVKG